MPRGFCVVMVFPLLWPKKAALNGRLGKFVCDFYRWKIPPFAAIPATSRQEARLLPSARVFAKVRCMTLMEPARSRSVRISLAASSSARPTSFRAFRAPRHAACSSRGFKFTTRQDNYVLPLRWFGSRHHFSLLLRLLIGCVDEWVFNHRRYFDDFRAGGQPKPALTHPSVHRTPKEKCVRSSFQNR